MRRLRWAVMSRPRAAIVSTAVSVAGWPSLTSPADATDASMPRATRRWRTRASAMGDRQVFPVQTMRISMAGV